MIALRLLSVGRPSIMLYDDGAFMTKKSVMVVVVRVPIPFVTRRVMAPIGCIVSLENPFSSVGEGLNLAVFIPIFMKASQNNMFAELPLSISMGLVV